MDPPPAITAGETGGGGKTDPKEPAHLNGAGDQDKTAPQKEVRRLGEKPVKSGGKIKVGVTFR